MNGLASVVSRAIWPTRAGYGRAVLLREYARPMRAWQAPGRGVSLMARSGVPFQYLAVVLGHICGLLCGVDSG